MQREPSPKKIVLQKPLKDPYTRDVDVMVWGASRPDLLELTITSLKEHLRFTAGRLFFYLDDGLFDQQRSDASAAIARAMNFDNVTQAKLGSYGFAIATAWSRDVSSPFVLSLEDDWECLQDIDLDTIVDCMVVNDNVNQIKLNKEKNHSCGFYDKIRHRHEYYQKYPDMPVHKMLKDSKGNEWPVLGSLHWFFNPAVWRTTFTIKHFKGFYRNVHLKINSEQGLLPKGERPSPQWYTDVLGVFTWGGEFHPPYFIHRGKAQSIHDAQGHV